MYYKFNFLKIIDPETSLSKDVLFVWFIDDPYTECITDSYYNVNYVIKNVIEISVQILQI